MERFRLRLLRERSKVSLVFLFAGIWLAAVIGGLTDQDIILANETGLDIASVYIDARNLHEMKPNDKILVTVTPTHHNLKLVFRGGADIDWPRFNFQGVHEIWFERDGVGFRARIQ